MRILSACLGAFVGFVIGVVSAMALSDVLAGGDTFGGGLYFFVAGPVGVIIGVVAGAALGLRALRYLQADEVDGVTRRKKAYLIASLVLGVPSLVGGVIWGNQRLTGPPSDDAMLAQFQRHRGTLERIAQMARADKRLERVDYNWTQPDNPRTISVSPMRIAEYRHLLDSAGVHRGFEHWDGMNEVDFLYWGQGSAISSDTDKGFAYLLKPPTQTLPSLDGCGPNGENVVQAYRHITGHWYLYYDYLPG